MKVCMHACVCACMRVCVVMYIRAYVYACVCVCVCALCLLRDIFKVHCSSVAVWKSPDLSVYCVLGRLSSSLLLLVAGSGLAETQ